MFSFSKRRSYAFDRIFKKLVFQLGSPVCQPRGYFHELNEILKIFGTQSGALYLFHPEKNQFDLKKWVGTRPLVSSIKKDFELVSYVRKAGRPLLKNDLLKKSHFFNMRQASQLYFSQTCSELLLPLLMKDRWVGLLHLGKRCDRDHYREEDMKALQIVGLWYAYHLSHMESYNEISQEHLQLKDVYQAQEQLIDQMRAEINSSARGILGLSEMILEGGDGPLSVDQKRHLKMIRSAGDTLLKMMESILSMPHMNTPSSEGSRDDLAGLKGLTSKEEAFL